MSIQRFRSLKEAASLTGEELSQLEQLSEHVLTRVVIESIRSYQAKLEVGIEDSVADLLDNFKLAILQHIFDTAEGWHSIQPQPFILPRDCRFCFRKGTNTVVVIEKHPHVRTLSFLAGMQEIGDTAVGADRSERATLSLPYTVFVFQFAKGVFNHVRCFWRTQPIHGFDDDLCNCVLPNIHVGGMVCLGTHPRKPTDICATCDEVIESFWTSRFNKDLSTEWEEKERISSLIATGRDWQRNSETDPMFILRVPFRYHKSLREVIDGVGHGEEVSDSSFRHKVSEEVDLCVKNLFHRIGSYVKRTKFDKYYPKEVTNALKHHVETSVAELVDLVAVLKHEVDKLSVQPDVQEEIKPVGALWGAFSD